MRFIVGLLIGLGLGLVAAMLLAPERKPKAEEETGEGARRYGGNNHQDTMAGLRRAMRGLREQLEEAWEEAAKAAQEAEEEMRSRYQKSVPGTRRSRS